MTDTDHVVIRREQGEQNIGVDQELSEHVVSVEHEAGESSVFVENEQSEKLIDVKPTNAERMVDVKREAIRIGADGDYMPLIDLGSFDVEEYDWEYWNYLNDKTDSGFYTVYEEQDGFTYFFRVERADNSCYQEIWSTEENGFARGVRTGWSDGETWHWDAPQSVMFSEAISATFYNKNEVDQKLRGKVDNDTLWNYYTDAQVDAILEDNYYTSDQVDDLLDDFAPENMISTTWANLVALRDRGELISGAYYRITDYSFVTSKVSMQSGNHQFDIVLLAISESMLSESGYACKHAGDHYFEREVTEGGIEWLYTMYVDAYGEEYGDEPMDHQDDLHSSDEFCDSGVMTHPETGEDVPVLYKTATDEYSIDDPDYDDAYFYEGTYDFDGDEYDLWSKYEFDGEEWVFMMQYALTPIVVEDGELVVSPIPETKIVPVNMNAWELKYCLDNDKELFDWAETDGKGVIYWLKDEFGNEAPYDFKNAMFKRYQVSSVSQPTLNNLRNMYLYQDGYYALSRNNNSKYWYTFVSSDGTSDGSLFGECSYNTIQPYIYLSPKGKNIKGINDIVLQSASRNNLGYNCHNITILSSVNDNNFTNCHSICGQSYINTFIDSNSMYFTIDRTSNGNYGNGTRYILGRAVDAPATGGGCSNINLGDNCIGVMIGCSCSNISFGQWGYHINIGAGTTSITFGNYCSYIEIGKMCSVITFTNYYRYITVESNVSRISFTTTGGSTTTYVQNVKVCSGLNNKSIAPTRRLNYEQIYYATGRIETAL